MSVRTVQVGECAQVINGFAFKSNLFTTELQGLPIARIRDVIRGHSETYYTGEYPASAIIQNGDLLVGMDGEFNIARWKGGRALLNQRVCKVEARNGKSDISFLRYALPVVLKRIEARTPFATVKHLSSEELKEEPMPLPDLPEQRRIAGLLERADRLRRTCRYALELSDSFLPAAFLELFGDPIKNENGWSVVPLEDACAKDNGIKAGPFGSSLKKDSYSRSGIRVYGQEQVIAGDFSIGDYYISESTIEEFSTYEVKPGDVLISLVGTFGRVVVVPDGIERGIINPRLLKISPKPSVLDSTFLAKLIEHPMTQHALMRMSHGGTMGILNAGLLRRLRIILPPLKEQQHFAALVARHERLRECEREVLRQADHLFQALLHRAFASA